MLASVVIPAFNAARTLNRCLKALLAQSVPRAQYEIIVVDDGSTDGTACLANSFPGIRLIRTLHCGAAAARNRGVLEARGEIVLFTDADCEPTENWIEEMLAPFGEIEHDIVGAKGVYATSQRSRVARFVQLEYEEKYARMSKLPQIDFVDTYSAAYRRDVFIANGGFDESFPSKSVEDQEFSFRLARQGHRMVFVPRAVVYHRHPTTLRGYAQRKFGIGFWKVRVHVRHAGKMWRDSHTPPSLKVQVLLCLALLAGIAAIPFLPMATLLDAFLGIAFLLSSIPLMLFVTRRDRAVASIALPMIIVRAASLGAGLFVGIFGEVSRSTRLKRMIDIVGSTAALLVCAPLMLLIALAIKWDSPGPVFFTQIRTGKGGRHFKMMKFRSMIVDAEARLETVIAQNPLPPPIFKIPNDPRVTRAGKFLRRFSLDELPQFFNVLKGEMSLVGPRPEEVRVTDQYTQWHRRRLEMKPGMTGPMQTDGRGLLSLDERVQRELDYINNYSIWLDLRLLARTLPAVIRGRGAY